MTDEMSEEWQPSEDYERTLRLEMTPPMNYLVVLRDHEGEWHGVNTAQTWDEAVAVYSGALGALRVIDYYPDYSPSTLKIIAFSRANDTTSYASAAALDEPSEVPQGRDTARQLC